MPVESVSRREYGFVLIDEYSRASRVLTLRAKSDASIELEIWAAKMENGTSMSCLTTRIAELVAERNWEYCEHKGSRVFNRPRTHLRRTESPNDLLA